MPDAGKVRALGAVTGALTGLDYAHPVVAVALDEVPEGFRRSLLDNVEPFYDRDERAGRSG